MKQEGWRCVMAGAPITKQWSVVEDETLKRRGNWTAVKGADQTL